MPVPQVDFNLQVVNTLPLDQRLPYWKIFVRALVSPIVWLYELFNGFMYNSVDTGYWSSIITYSKGDRVRDISGVYESLTDSNLNNPITDTTYWYKVLNYFIGADERAVYNGRKINFEWALNRYFNTTFRQPNDPVTPTPSDIFITDVPAAYTSLVMYPTDYRSGIIYPTTSAPYFMYNTPVYTGATTYQFDINIPLAIFDALGSTDAIREAVVRNFADKYTAVGTFYNVVTY